MGTEFTRRARGAATVEFAMAALIFFVFIFCLLEVARGVYLFNTVQEITRRAARAAVVTDFSDGAAMERLRRHALFRTTDGTLMLGGPIDQRYVRIEYLSLSSDAATGMQLIPAASMPPCPPRNVLNCANDPNGADCIRFVRVQLCVAATGSCAPVPYQTMLAQLLPFSIDLPLGTTVLRAESLGYRPGMAMCL